jgi:hypothetical protein
MTAAIRKIAEERLLAEAVRDWMTNRAFVSNQGHYKFKPEETPGGMRRGR